MPNSPLPALIFDFDGTLIESAPELARCLNALLAEDGRRPLTQAQVEDMIGNGVAKLVERGLRASGGVPSNLDAHVKRFMAIYDSAPITDTPIYDGVTETLARLGADGHVMAICTNKPYAPTMKILDGIGMTHHFSVVGGGDSFPVRKPDPGHLEGVLDMLGIARDQAIMIGDSPNDISCAVAAGVRSIAVTYGYSRIPHAELGADRLIDRFDALPAAIADLG
ncbi:MAG: phosphoglycolate phosphatase [Alphaproteobacteria bacterium]|nr:phosphoglycolate phosphatase [Alphaproteobacteria bacterium]